MNHLWYFKSMNKTICISFSMELKAYIVCHTFTFVIIIYFNQLCKYVLRTVKMFLKNIILNLFYLIIYNLNSNFWPTLKLWSAALLMPLTTCVALFHKFLLLTLSRNFQASPRWLQCLFSAGLAGQPTYFDHVDQVWVTTYFSVRPL